MPWHISDKAAGCSGYAVVKDDTGEVVTCHKTKGDAEAHIKALYASEADKMDMSGGDNSPTSRNAQQGTASGMPSTNGRKKKVQVEKADDWEGLNERQSDQAESYCEIVMEYGQFDQSSGPDGAHYGGASDNPFKSDGLKCSSCVFFEDGACHLVSGQIDPEGICKLWIIPETNAEGRYNSIEEVAKATVSTWNGVFSPR